MDSQLRGVSGPQVRIPPVPGWEFGGNMSFSFLVYGTDGESLTFMYEDATGAQVIAALDQEVTIVKDELVGSYRVPLKLHASESHCKR